MIIKDSKMQLPIQNFDRNPQQVKKNCLRLYKWAMEKNLRSTRLVIADEHYYKKTLQQRRDILSAPDIKFLCKTIIFENTDYNQKFSGPYYPKYVGVMVQYIAKIHTEKLTKQLKNYQQKNATQKASKQHFHYRLADQTISNKLTGYQHNGVVPIMMKHKMPIVFSHRIKQLKPEFFWMGGGHPWVKMRISFDEFKKSYDDDVLVADITYEDNAEVEINDEK